MEISGEDVSDADEEMGGADSLVDIGCLPDEILEYILLMTSPYCDFKSAMQVCKRWYNVAKGVIHYYQQQFEKAIGGEIGAVDLFWHCHHPDSGPTVTERYSHSACYYDKSVYIFGGCTSTSTTFNDLWRFDLEHSRWVRPLATGTYPSPKACASLVVHNDSLILFGGWSHPTPYTFHQASKFFNQLNIYNPQLNRWTQVTTIDSPDGIAGHGATVVNDSMIIFGGYHGHGNSSNSIWVLNLTQMVWTKQLTTDPKPLPRYSHTQVAIDDQHILVLGGCGGPNMQFSDAWLLDMSSEPWKWKELTIENLDRASQHLWCHPGCKVGDKIIVLGKNPTRAAPVPKDTKRTTGRPLQMPPPATPPPPVVAPAQSVVLESVPPVLAALATVQLEAASGLSLDDSAVTAGAAAVIAAGAAAVIAAGGGGKDVAARQNSNSTTPLASAKPHTAGMRTGMPSVRPNAMKDRRRQLEALNRYEDRLRAAAHQSANSSSPITLTLTAHRYTAAGMCIHTLDISEVLDSGRVSWMSVRGLDLSDAPDEAIFYSLVEGRGEIVMFGGIRGDARSLQRGNTSLQPQAVSNDIHFLSFKRAGVR